MVQCASQRPTDNFNSELLFTFVHMTVIINFLWFFKVYRNLVFMELFRYLNIDKIKYLVTLFGKHF